MFRERAHKLHFVGIGGIGMSGIAEVLLNLGFDVRGSDLHLSPVTSRLENLGAKIFTGHDRQHVTDADVVVVSSAVKADNPEVVEARRAGIQVIRRAEMLAELMRLKYGIAVAGSHGKTTTTSLIATLLAKGGFDPTMVIGGRLKSISSNARLGEGEYLVAEADESDGSFLRLMPTIAVVTNIDAEHLDHWRGGLPQIVEAFVDFVNKVPFYGSAVMCLDHPTVQSILPRIEKHVITYGLSTQADYSADQIEMHDGSVSFDVQRRHELLGRIQVNMIGRHNVANILAAIAVADEVGVPFEAIRTALAEFDGVGRRFEIKGSVDDILVVDDYGHHPAEIRATLEAAREAYKRRLIVAFQPHRYSRTQALFDDFATCFNACHRLLVTDIYAAGEEPIDGVHSSQLVEAVRSHGHQGVQWVGDVRSIASELQNIVKPGDLVLTLGAGNIWQAGEELLVYLGGQNIAGTSGAGSQIATSTGKPRV
ncbi:MAG: UDP-N-acetylmuramate--L-alanine ligase [Myxococcota bacterium]